MGTMTKVLKWVGCSRRRRIIATAVLSLLLGHLWLTWRIHRFVDHFCRATIEGTTLCDPDVVFVYDHLLKGPLGDELKSGSRISTRPYDAFEFKFARCTHSAFVTTATHRTGLRLRFDPFRNQFHVVGYWTIR